MLENAGLRSKNELQKFGQSDLVPVCIGAQVYVFEEYIPELFHVSSMDLYKHERHSRAIGLEVSQGIVAQQL